MKRKIGNLFKGDKAIWMVFLFLCLISLTEVFSASSTLTYKSGDYLSPVLKHGSFLLMGLGAMILTLNIKCKYFKVLTMPMLIMSVIFLLWALLFGHAENDASRWVNLGLFKFQPSEIAKGTMVLVTAQILSATQSKDGADSRAFWWILMVCVPMAVLIMLENLSTAALISFTIFMMMVVGRVPVRQLGGTMGVVAILVALAVSFVMIFGDAGSAEKDAEKQKTEVSVNQGGQTEHKSGGILHRAGVWKSRIFKFFDPAPPADSVDLDKDAQSAHSNIAIASSGLVGVGPGNSVERDFLSQAFSDFIFSIIVEEWGLLGAGFVAFLYIVLLFRTGKIAGRCENNFPAFLAMGLALMFVTQALFNMCVAVGLVPVTGQPLPLISKGGTSTIINCVYFGVILSISRSAKKKQPVATETQKEVTVNP